MIKTKKENKDMNEGLDYTKQQLEQQKRQVDRLEHRIGRLTWQYTGMKRKVSRHQKRIRKMKRQLGLVTDFDHESF
ncbi:hypothetical protein [Priestia abyssalis]|uniref:hypothetical protein n=1 Tax=Priestia abyssalis TaxID=1221450 RepID=UPI000994DD32|nr:hypothetical protein [Priestia abyssalis]